MWKSDLWKGREDIPPLSTWTLEGNKVIKQLDIKRYRKTSVFIAIKYVSYYGESYEEIVGVNSGSQCGLKMYRSRGLWVHPKHRGLGLSTWLLNETIDYGRKRGCEIIWSYPKLSALYAYTGVNFVKQSYFDGDNCVVTRPLLL